MDPTLVYVADPGDSIASNLRQRHAGSERAVVHCTSVPELLDRLEPESALCIVADAALPGMDMLELLDRLRAYHVPVLCMAENCGVATAVQWIKAGAEDCVEKTGPLARVLEKLDAFIDAALERCTLP